MNATSSRPPAQGAARRFILLACLFATLLGSSFLRAGETYSLVINGRILDVPSVPDPSLGTLLSAEIFTLIARADGQMAVAVSPERGHIVLSWPQPGATLAPIAGLKTPNLTLVVNGIPLTTKARLLNGVPYLETTVIQTVLEGLKFNVLISPDSHLISVFRPPPEETLPGSGPAPGNSSGMPGDDMLRMVQQGSMQALEGMGGQGSAQSSAQVTTGSSNGVCSAMDLLRAAWESTEPSQKEKETFRSLAETFQAAKDNKTPLEASDLALMDETLMSFRKKVDARTEATKGWSPPNEARKVKSYGVSFLDSFGQAMDLCQEMVTAMKNNDQEYFKEGEKTIETLKGLEKTIQEQGTRFNEEVLRVRSVYRCGPAKLGAPPS